MLKKSKFFGQKSKFLGQKFCGQKSKCFIKNLNFCSESELLGKNWNTSSAMEIVGQKSKF